MNTTPPPKSAFRKSAYSEPNANCVEVAFIDGGAVVRDSKTQFNSGDDKRLTVDFAGWGALRTHFAREV